MPMKIRLRVGYLQRSKNHATLWLTGFLFQFVHISHPQQLRGEKGQKFISACPPRELAASHRAMNDRRHVVHDVVGRAIVSEMIR